MIMGKTSCISKVQYIFLPYIILFAKQLALNHVYYTYLVLLWKCSGVKLQRVRVSQHVFLALINVSFRVIALNQPVQFQIMA